MTARSPRRAPFAPDTAGCFGARARTIATYEYATPRSAEGQYITPLISTGFDEKATWLDQLKPAFGEDKFFYEDEYRAMKEGRIAIRTV